MSNETWMTDLPECLSKSVPIVNLAIPGTHNSMSYGINSNSPIAPDANSTIRKLYGIVPAIVRRWATTQQATVISQLELGVRYFDLRIVKQGGDFYYAHGLRAMKWDGPLREIINFLNKHPKEFIILDFQHFYECTTHDHKYLQWKLKQMFGSKLLLPYTIPLTKCTLETLQNEKKNILVIYRDLPHGFNSMFFKSDIWPTPWPDVDDSYKLRQYLEQYLKHRRTDRGHVLQCIITPSGKYIALRLTQSLKDTAVKLNRKLIPWIETKQPGDFDKAVNVVLGDFVDHDGGRFCKAVINLNFKLTDYDKYSGGTDIEQNLSFVSD